MASRRRHSRELRDRAVRLARESERPLAALASELGVQAATLSRWVLADQADQAREALLGAGLVRPLRVRDEVSLDPGQLAPGRTVHIGDLTDARGQPAHLYGLEPLWWGDYTGDVVARSNHRSLLRDFPEQLVSLRDALRHDGLAILPSSLANQQLAGALLSLGEDPLYDPDDRRALLAEMADEAWESYVRRDVERLLERRHGIDCSDPDRGIGEQRLRALFTASQRRFGDHFADNAVTVVYPSLEQVVAEVAAVLRHEFPVPGPPDPPADRAAGAAAHRGGAFGHGPVADRPASGLASPPVQPPTGRGRSLGR